MTECLDIPHPDVDRDTLALAHTVWGLGSQLVITTNYDGVLRGLARDRWT